MTAPPDLRAEFLDRISGFVTAAFALVAALAWNDAIQTLFRQVFGEHGALPAKLAYALLVTVGAVLAVWWVGKATGVAKGFLSRPLPWARKGPRREPPPGGPPGQDRVG